MFSAGQLSIFPPICFNFAERFFHLNKSVCNGIELKNWNTLLMNFKKMVLRALRFASDFHLFLVFCEKKLKILFDLYILKMIILCNQSKKLNNRRYERNGKCPWTQKHFVRAFGKYMYMLCKSDNAFCCEHGIMPI